MIVLYLSHRIDAHYIDIVFNSYLFYNCETLHARVMILEAKFEEKRIELRIVRDAAFPSLIC